jgi:FMN phosphatase YigB (HAD superfamily)
MPAERPPRAILFDLDGTLYDKRRLPLRLGLSCLADWRILLAFDAARRTKAGIDFGSRGALIDALVLDASLRLSGADPDFLHRWYEERLYRRFVGVLRRGFRARPELAAYLAERRRAAPPPPTPPAPPAPLPKLGVLSDYGHVDDRLYALGLDPGDFEVRLSSEDEGALKPSPRPFRRAAELLGVSPADVLVVGDIADSDGAGADGAGMAFRQLASAAEARSLVADLRAWR